MAAAAMRVAHQGISDGVFENRLALLPSNESDAALAAWCGDAVADSIGGAHAIRADALSDRVDAALTHPVSGGAVFVMVMALLFTAIFWLAKFPMDGIDWIWPAGENPASSRHAPDDAVRLLAPFDPLVWDRRRFELFWGWAYRFEAYTPAAKRVRGYYALPLLWRGQVIGWGNLAVQQGRLQADLGYIAGSPPADAGYSAALDDELGRISRFMGL